MLTPTSRWRSLWLGCWSERRWSLSRRLLWFRLSRRTTTWSRPAAPHPLPSSNPPFSRTPCPYTPLPPAPLFSGACGHSYASCQQCDPWQRGGGAVTVGGCFVREAWAWQACITREMRMPCWPGEVCGGMHRLTGLHASACMQPRYHPAGHPREDRAGVGIHALQAAAGGSEATLPRPPQARAGHPRLNHGHRALALGALTAVGTPLAKWP